MRRAILNFLIIAFAAYGQTVERTVPVPYAKTHQDLQEIATIVRSVVDIRDVRVNPDQTIYMNASGERIAAGEWIVAELGSIGPQAGDWREFRMPMERMPVMRVYNAGYTFNSQDLQQLVTLIRVLADVQRIFTYNPAKAVAARGDEDSILLADWIVKTLAQGTGFPPAIRDSTTESVRMYSLPRATVGKLQELVTRIRSEAGLQRVFVYAESHAVAFRGTPEKMAAAERILREYQ